MLVEGLDATAADAGDGVATNCDVDMVDDRDAKGNGTVVAVVDDGLVPLTFS